MSIAPKADVPENQLFYLAIPACTPYISLDGKDIMVIPAARSVSGSFRRTAQNDSAR